jgi:mRNA interferase MazF
MPSFGEKTAISRQYIPFLLGTKIHNYLKNYLLKLYLYYALVIFMEKFLQWIKVKATLHFLDFHPPFVSEGQIWWVSLGENIGTEINGKGNLFSRPVIIFKKLSNKFYAVIPASTKIHSGNWYFPYTFKDLKVVACMHQVRSIDYRRLSTCLGTLNENEFLELKKLCFNFIILI